MPENGSVLDRWLPLAHRSELIAIGIATHFGFNIVAAVAFRLAALSSSWSAFLAWRIAGNLAGFVTVLALTVLLRFSPAFDRIPDHDQALCHRSLGHRGKRAFARTTPLFRHG